MEELEDKIIKILNGHDLNSDLSILSIDDKMNIISQGKYNFLVHFLFERIEKEEIKFISKEESKIILNNKDKYDPGALIFWDFNKYVDFDDGYEKEYKNRIMDEGDSTYIYALKDPTLYMNGNYYTWVLFTDEALEKILLSNMYNNSISNIVSGFKSDVYKEKYLKLLDPYFKLLTISSFKSDDFKERHIKEIGANKRGKIIASFKSDKLKKKYLNAFSDNKGKIISSLKTDEDKIYYLKKYKPLLSSDEKGQIIAGMNNLSNIYRCNDYLTSESVLSSFLLYLDKEKYKDLFIRYLKYIKKDDYLFDIFYKVIENKELRAIVLNNINDVKVLGKVISLYNRNELEDYNSYDITDLTDIIISKLNTSQIERFVKDYSEFINYKFILSCNNEDVILDALKHNTTLNKEYTEEMYKLFKIASKHYNMNLNHLIELAKISSCEILKSVDNENIKDACNLSEEDFQKYLKLFDEKNYDMDISSLSTMVSALLQKQFRNEYPVLLDIFINTLHYIDDGLIENARYNIDEVYSCIDKSKYNITHDILVNGVMNKDESILEIFNKMTNDYIVLRRNYYVNQNLTGSLKTCSDVQYEDNPLIKYFFKSLDEETIYNILINYKEDNTPSENEIINNQELLRNLISFKKGISNSLSNEDKKYLKPFNKIVIKKVNKYIKLKHLFIKDLPIYYDVKQAKKDHLIEVMSYLKVDKIRDLLFSNEEVFNDLLSHLNKYDMVAWDERFTSLCHNTDLLIDGSVTASIINNYNMISNESIKKEKEGKGFSIANEIDYAEALDSNADIYASLLGEEDYILIKSNPSPNRSSKKKDYRLKESIECLKRMHQRKYITVPSIDENVALENGKVINVMVGNTNDTINLTYGERTGACMRIGGAGSSLFDFCLTNENGFHISFNDPATGALVSRVSCFRNGNTLFLNQLRYSLIEEYTNQDIVEACKIISNKIIEMTKDSKYPIVNVIASNGYALSCEEEKTLDYIDIQKGFEENFYTDINLFNAVVVATSTTDVTPIKTGPNNAEKYPIGRAKVKKYENASAIKAIKHIEALDMLYDGVEIDEIGVKDKDIIYAYVGEDWYLGVTKDNEVIKYIQKNSLNPNKANEELLNYEGILQNTNQNKIDGGLNL